MKELLHLKRKPYIPLFRQFRMERKLHELAKITAHLTELEYILTLPSIMSMLEGIGIELSEDTLPDGRCARCIVTI